MNHGRTLADYLVHLIISLLTAGAVFGVVNVFADDPVPALCAVVWFAAYWGVWLFVIDSDGPSSGGGGGSFLDSLF